MDDSFGSFSGAYDAGRAQILFRRIVADLETPIGAYLKLAEGRRNTFLLESVQDGATRGRYSMIGLDPDVILKVEGGKAHWVDVKTGMTVNGSIEVFGALQPGDQVVRRGTDAIKDGSDVRPEAK